MAAADPGYSGPELCRLTACDTVDLLTSRQISPGDLVEASLARMAQTGRAINATVTLCPDRARAAARDVDTASLLAGLPLTIKDLTPVAGVRTTFGTPALAHHVPDTSDPLVLRLESRGAVVVGKSNTPEMGAGANTFNPIFGCTRNPWDTRMNAAGSSGGAAAALATGEIWLSHGSDVGGSLRTPASFCGIVGLRPSPGVAGGAGRDAFDRMGVQGPMARTVEDCALFLDALAGWDPAWPLSYPAPGQSYLETCRTDAGRIRIAWSPDLGGLAPVTPEMADTLATALGRLQASDVDITEETPALSDIESCFRTLRALNMWVGSRVTPSAVSDHFKPALKDNIAAGGALSVDQIADARIARSRLYDTMRTFLARFDVLACPVSGIGPLPVEIEYPPEVEGVKSRDYLDWLRFTFLATICGLPALSLPVARDSRGLPVGLQLIGPPQGEARLLQVARRLEQATGFATMPIDPVVTHTS